MRITIDLRDPEVKAHIEKEVDARLREIAADRISGVMDEIIKTKMDRYSPEHLDNLAKAAIKEKAREYFNSPGWNNTSEFRKILVEIATQMIKESVR